LRSARKTAATATASAPGLRFETVRSVRIAVNAYHRQYDDRGGFGRGVDKFAAARKARLVGKTDDFAHFSAPLTDPDRQQAGSIGAYPAIKGLARLTLR
jgi:hypothetical protein